MEHKDSRPRSDKREKHSKGMPVPMIILDNIGKTSHRILSLSRSTGDLNKELAEEDYEMAGKPERLAKFSSSVSDRLQDTSERNVDAIGLYCSPRMPRRLARTNVDPTQKQSGVWLESVIACNLNYLDPGSRVSSTVSLNSEFTSRSVGLISDDSNSESSQHSFKIGIMDGSVQKRNVLKRFYSNPEKDDKILHYTAPVRRNSKSMGNMQQENVENSVYIHTGSDSTTDENFKDISDGCCDIDETLAERTGYTQEGSNFDNQSEQNFVTAVTGSASLRDGRIQKWLKQISDQSNNLNS